MDRSKLLALTLADLPDLLERSVEVAPMDARRKIFVNRNLRLDKIEVIGFDMDYTLAIYKKIKIEELAFNLTVDKLVSKRGYPDAIRSVKYEADRVIRGLVCDKKRGNIFKMDRYGHIGRVFHSAHELPKEERIKLYRTKKVELDSYNYAWVDTLFSLPEACLYSQLVEFFDTLPEDPLKKKPSYRHLYQDIRECIDQAHADGSLKSVIRKDPATFIEREVELAHALHRFRSSGKRLFVLTNSLWDYTSAVMSHILDGVLEGYPSWRNYFDSIIVGASKPAFFVKRNPFLKVDEATGELAKEPATTLERGRVYQGGNLRDFERLAHFAGERILYVGDHIYGDILRSKKSSLWRTAMVVPELEDVVWHQDLFAADLTRFAELEDEMRRVDYEINYYKLLLSSLARLREAGEGTMPGEEDLALREATQYAREALDRLKAQLRNMVREHHEIEQRVDTSANRYWGLTFCEGSETSLFGKQVEDYACVYTSRVSNFLFYSPIQYFRSPRISCRTSGPAEEPDGELDAESKVELARRAGAGDGRARRRVPRGGPRARRLAAARHEGRQGHAPRRALPPEERDRRRGRDRPLRRPRPRAPRRGREEGRDALVPAPRRRLHGRIRRDRLRRERQPRGRGQARQRDRRRELSRPQPPLQPRERRADRLSAPMPRFELHAHTTCSDGVYTPSGLVEHAFAAGLAAVAVTDHDTLRGIPEATARGRDLGVEVIPGIEVTCEAAAQVSGALIEVHILGLFVDAGAPSRDLTQAIARLRTRRLERMHEMIGKLKALGVRVDAAEVLKLEGASFGRPHLARALVAAGACTSTDDAFRRYLAEGRPAYCEKALLPSAEAIAGIRQAGGIAVLAHPGRYKEAPDLDRLAAQGLRGLEVYYPAHNEERTAFYAAEARRLALVASGGGDFHGDPGRKPPIGGQPMPDDILENLRRAAATR